MTIGGLLEHCNNLERAIKDTLEQETKDFTREQLLNRYEIAKDNFNRFTPHEEMDKDMRFIIWTKLETTYLFFYDKLYGDKLEEIQVL